MSSNNSINTKDKRARNFATIVYPESAPADWFSILEELAVPCFVSPLHDKDLNPDGEPKKAHYHVVTMYEGKKSVDQAKELFSRIGGVGCQVVQSIRGQARYLCHLDNPEKFQYNPDDVRSIAADYFEVIGLAIDKHKAIGEMMDFCEKYDVSSFYLLAKYAQLNRSDWHRVLCDSSAIYMREYLKSRYWSKTNNLTVIVDPETGEAIL